MKYLKKYKDYLESIIIDVALINIDINESLGIFYENILKSIGAEENDIFDTFNLPKDEFVDKLNLDILTSNTGFINSLSSIGLKKSILQSTEDLETFVNRPSRFVMIYKIESNELENPNYIIFQSWNETLDKWENPKLYKITGDIKLFYDKLSSKVIELELDGVNYIYQTSNKNEWILQNGDGDEIFKKYLRKDEFEKLINDKKVKMIIR
jgi:hypothetical protein